MLHALHSVCLSHVWLPHRLPSKNNRNVLKISYIKGKYLVNRYLPLVFCAYSACSKCRIRGQNQERVSQKSGACFPKIRSVFPKPFICFAKQGRIAGANTTGGWIETTSHHHHSFILFCHFFQSFYYYIMLCYLLKEGFILFDDVFP